MKGFLLAEAITREHAKTFYFASRFLKKDKRNAAYAVYALCRLSDDAVDNPVSSHSQQTLEELERKISDAYKGKNIDDPLLSAFRQTIEQYHIPQEYFQDLISGIRLDLEKNRYSNFAQLLDYCYKVAGVVGLIMLRIFGYQDKQAERYAVELGIAMQLTNILRDIKEDFARGRIYLPQDELQHFQVTESDISSARINEKFRQLLKFQIARARKYYQSAKSGIPLIEDKNSRFVVLAMSDIYSGILKDIEKNNYDVFSRRARVSIIDKINAVLKIILKGT